MLLKEYGRLKSRLLRPFGLEPYHDHRSAENGEWNFLRHLRSLPEVERHDSIIDVGANFGDWTAALIALFSDSPIRRFYCVEPLPSFAEAIKARFGSDSRVVLLRTALSDTPSAPISMYQVGHDGRLYRSYRNASKDLDASQRKNKEAIEYKVPVSTGTETFAQINCNPYLIKIDCDGHDLHVLRGFADVIRAKRPIVQFEYCDFWIAARSRLRDACKLLHGCGYLTYKIFPSHLIRFSFNPLFETFGYQNIVAVPAEMPSFGERIIYFQTNTIK